MRICGLLGLLCLVAIGCTREDRPRPAPSAGADDSGPAPVVVDEDDTGTFTIHLDGIDQPLGFAIARRSPTFNEIEIELGERETPECQYTKKPPNQYLLSIRVPPGPGGRFFAGAPFGTKISGGHRETSLYGFDPSYTRVELDEIDPRPGGRIRGRATIPSLGSGSFEAIVCDGNTGKLDPLPAEAPASPVAGNVAGERFSAASATIEISRQASSSLLRRLTLYPDGNATCGADAADALQVVDMAGASTVMPLAGSPQPAQVFKRIEGVRDGATAPAWVSFDALSFEPGARISGQLVARSRPGAPAGQGIDVAGRFEARICP